MVASTLPILTPLTGTENVAIATPGTTLLFASVAAVSQQAFNQPIVQQEATITTAVSGFSITMSNAGTSLVIGLTQTTAAGTVTLPSAPVNKQLAVISFNQNITALTVTASTTSTTIAFAPSTASTQSAGTIEYIYQTSNTTWYRYG